MLGSNIRFSYSFFDKFCVEDKMPTSNDLILKSRDSHELLLMKQIDIQPQDYEETVATLQYQKGLRHEQLLSLVDYHAQPSRSKIIVLYEFCTISLQYEFQNRLEQKRYFEQSQLWSIFTSFVFGLAYLQRANVGHGSISLHDCFLNQQGFIKVSDPTCATSNPYTIVKGYFYSPQILRCLLNQTQQQINIFKSDVFSLGCCMLQLSLMKDISLLFDYKNGFIDKALYRSFIRQLQSLNFSKQFTGFITQMILIDYHQRPDFLLLQTEIFNLLALDPAQQCNLSKKSLDIKSSLSSLFRSKGQGNFQLLQKQQFLQNQIIKFGTEFQYGNYHKNENYDELKEQKKNSSQLQPNKKIFKQKITNFVSQINRCLQQNTSNHKQINKSEVMIGFEKNSIQLMKFNEQKRKRNKFNKIKNSEIDSLGSFETDYSANSHIFVNQNEKQKENKKAFGSNIILNQKINENKQNIQDSKSEKITYKINKKTNKTQEVYTNPDFLKMMQMDVQQIIGRRAHIY